VPGGVNAHGCDALDVEVADLTLCRASAFAAAIFAEFERVNLLKGLHLAVT
jgi:hypothetical protein